MEHQRSYPILILQQERGFRVLLTAHACRRVHERRPDLWDATRWRLAEPFKLDLAARGCALKALGVRGECKLVVNGLRVVYDMSNSAARIVTVMTRSVMTPDEVLGLKRTNASQRNESHVQERK